MARHGELAEALLVVSSTFGSGPTRHGELAEIKLTAATSTRHGELAEISLTASGLGPVVNPISDTYVNSLDTVTITGTLANGQAADSWTFTQTGGDTLTAGLVGTGNVRTFTAPPTVTGTTILVQLVAIVGGAAADPVYARYFIRPHQWWRKTDVGWSAIKPQRIP